MPDRSVPRTWPGCGSWPCPPAVSAAIRLSPRTRKAAIEIRARTADVGRARSGSSKRRRSRSPGTRPLGSPAPLVVDLCAGIGGDTLALAPLGAKSWPSTSIRACAVGSSRMPRSTTSGDGCCRSGPGPRRSRFPAVRGSIWTRTAGGLVDGERSSARGLRARPRILAIDRIRRVPAGRDQAQPGQRLRGAFRRSRSTKSS